MLKKKKIIAYCLLLLFSSLANAAIYVYKFFISCINMRIGVGRQPRPAAPACSFFFLPLLCNYYYIMKNALDIHIAGFFAVNEKNTKIFIMYKWLINVGGVPYECCCIFLFVENEVFKRRIVHTIWNQKKRKHILVK